MKEYIPKKCKNPNCDKNAFSSLVPYCSQMCKNKVKTPNLKLKPILKASPKCCICKNRFTPKSIYDKTCQEIDCRTKWAMQVVEKQKLAIEKKKKQANAREKADLKEKLKTLSDYEKDAKKSFQKFIRLRDANLPCISCNNSKTTDWAGGHYFSAGMYSRFMFDERNCHKQCNTHCNKYLSGNLIEYRKGLIKRYGISFVEELEALSDEKRNYKYTKEELIAKKLEYDIKIKEIK